MKKFLLTSVVLFIAGGFYYAYHNMSQDIVAINPRHQLASVKENIKQDLPERVVTVVGDNLNSAIDNIESPVGLSKDTLSGSLVNRLLFSRSEIEITPEEDVRTRNNDSNSEFVETPSVDLDDERKQEIIKIYNETPQIFNIEILRKYLSENGYEDDFIAEVCREILESE